jgi:hypothetical protein
MTDRAALEERRKADRRHQTQRVFAIRLFLYADPGFPIRHHLTRETDR